MDSAVVNMIEPKILGDSMVIQDTELELTANINGVGFLSNQYDTVNVSITDSLQFVLDTVSSGTVVLLDSGTYYVNLIWPATNHIILSVNTVRKNHFKWNVILWSGFY